MICRRDLALLIAAAGLAAAMPLALGAQDRATVGVQLSKAAEAIARGDGIAAEMAVRGALDAGAARPDVAALAGEAQLVQGNTADARRWLEPRNFSAATQAQGLHVLGRVYLETGDLAQAAAAFDDAMKAGGGTAPLWVDIARLRYRSGEQHLALGAVDRALAIDPNHGGALHFRAQLARDAMGLTAALPWLERGLKAAPDDLELLGEYAAVLAEAGRHTDMLNVARRMVEIDPRHPRAYFLQAMLAARVGRYDIARRMMWQTGGDYDDQPAGLLLNGILELETGNPALAVERFDLLCRMQPDNPRARLLLGRSLLANGEANEVVARLGPLADKANAETYLLALVGRAYEQLGDRARAAPYLDRAAKPVPVAIGALPIDPAGELAVWRFRNDPTSAPAAVPLLRQMMGSARAADARALAGALQVRFPASSDVDRLAGDVWLLTGSPEQALDAYRQSAQVRNDAALARRAVAAELARGQRAQAQQRLTQFVVRNPRSADALQMLGQMKGADGDWNGAAGLLARANHVRGGTDPLLLAHLAQAQLNLGLRAQARASALRAYRLHRANRVVIQAMIANSDGAQKRALQARLAATSLQ